MRSMLGALFLPLLLAACSSSSPNGWEGPGVASDRAPRAGSDGNGNSSGTPSKDASSNGTATAGGSGGKSPSDATPAIPDEAKWLVGRWDWDVSDADGFEFDVYEFGADGTGQRHTLKSVNSEIGPIEDEHFTNFKWTSDGTRHITIDGVEWSLDVAPNCHVISFLLHQLVGTPNGKCPFTMPALSDVEKSMVGEWSYSAGPYKDYVKVSLSAERELVFSSSLTDGPYSMKFRDFKGYWEYADGSIIATDASNNEVGILDEVKVESSELGDSLGFCNDDGCFSLDPDT